MPDGSLVSTTRPDGVRVHVRGRLDGSAVERLRALLAEGGQVRLDLSRADALPVEVLRTLAAAHRAAPGALVLEQPSPAATRSLRVSGLDRVLAVEVAAAAPRTGVA